MQQPQPDQPPLYPGDYLQQPAAVAPGLSPSAVTAGVVSLACTTCGSDNTQALSVLYEGGLSHSTHHTSTVGFAPRGGIGTAASTTHGKSQTVQSAKAAPPDKRKWGALLAGGLFVAVIAFSAGGFLGYVLFLACGGGATYYAYTAHQFNQTVFPDLYGQWKRKYACLRCGGVFTPAGLLPPQPRIPS